MVSGDALVNAPGKVPWPYSILFKRGEGRKLTVFNPPKWHSRHHVVPSKSNVHMPQGGRGYFDCIPAVRRVQGGEFDCVLMQQPYISDRNEHHCRVQRRFDAFPYFAPTAEKMRARSRMSSRAASPQTPSSPEPEVSRQVLFSSTELAAAAAARQKRGQRKRVQKLPTRESCCISGMSEFLDEIHVGDFLKWVDANHMTLVGLWRQLDQDGSMSLHKMEFFRGLRKLRYRGDLEKLWQNLDRDDTGILSFLEFAPENAMDLARFKQWALERFGSLQQLYRFMDGDHNGKVTFHEFRQCCISEGLPKSLHSSLGTLFQLVDDPQDASSRGTITETELQFLEVWQPPIYLREKASMPALQKFRKALVDRHYGNALVAWRLSLDKDHSMKVSYEEFTIACRALTASGIAEASPACGVASLYCAIDHDRSGWFTLRDWDKHMHRCLSAVVEWATRKFGKVSDFIRAAETEQNKGIEFVQWKNELRDGLGFNRMESLELFEGLARRRDCKAFDENHERLFAHDVLYLDRWKPAQELQEDKAWERMTMRHLVSLDGSSEIMNAQDQRTKGSED